MACQVQETRGAGFVLYRRNNNEIRYLILQAAGRRKHWSPPKGHVETGETDIETALREIEEETGITLEHLQILDFTRTLQYQKSTDSRKRVTLFLAEMKGNKEIRLSHEHIAYRWATADEACQLILYQDFKRLLTECHEFIQNIKQ